MLNENKIDAIIIGGGPAGSSCALWLKMLGYSPCIIEERPTLGGLQNDSPYKNQWIAVLPGQTGQQVADSIQKHISDHEIPLYLESRVVEVETIENGYRVKFEDKHSYSQKTLTSPNLVVASGVRPATGGLQSSDKLLIGPGKQIANLAITGKNVAILGGGDSAFENNEFIKEKGGYPHIYAQSDEKHTLKARFEFLERVDTKDVSLHEGPLTIDHETNTINGKQYDTIIALYGWTANIPFLSPINVDLNEKGFVATNPMTAESSKPGLYAIGEVAARAHPCCVTAMADGVVAAKAIQHRFELVKKQSLLFFNKIKPIALIKSHEKPEIEKSSPSSISQAFIIN